MPSVKHILPAEKIVGRWLAAAENKRYRIIKRREINPRPTITGVRAFLFVLLFTRLALQGVVFYTFVGALSGGSKPPLCKGRWLAQARRRDCKRKKFIAKQSLSRLRRQLPLHKGAFLYVHLWLINFPDKHCFCGHKSNFYFIFSFISAIPLLNPSRKPYQLSFTL